jgi:prepilin-type N-terminal cleavage/methylation domain-containing protein
MNANHNNKGFTFLELLTAMSMMVVLAASLFASLYIGFKAKESAERAVGPVRQARIVMKLLQQDIEAALPPIGTLAGEFQGIDGVDSRGRNNDNLWFFTTHYQQYHSAAASDIVQVELLLMPSNYDDTNLLVRRTAVNLLPSVEPQYYEEILCRNVLSFNLSYYDGYEWLDNWDSASLDDSLPLAVHIMLSTKQPTEDPLKDYDIYAVEHVFLLPCSQAATATNATVM